MFHLFTGLMIATNGRWTLSNELFGIEVHYKGVKTKGTFSLFPYLDDNHKTIQYFAFDTAEQKAVFESMLKISGIGPKTAYMIARLDKKELANAVEAVDFKYFQTLPGIGPKTAKRLVVELKHTIAKEDLTKISINDKLYKDIVKALKNLGYESTGIKAALQKCPIKLETAKLGEIIKRLISNL